MSDATTAEQKAICNLEAEEMVLGAILIDPEVFTQVSAVLTSTDFYLQAHRDVFHAAQLLQSQGRTTSLTEIAAWLHDFNKLQPIGGRDRLVALADACLSTANIDRIARLVKEKSDRRRFQALCREAIEQTADQDSFQALLDEHQKLIADLAQQQHDQSMSTAADDVSALLQQLDDLRTGRTVRLGVSSGLNDYDAITEGLGRGDLVILAGRPAMGKTAISLNILLNVARAGQRVALFSLEMSTEQLYQRMLSQLSGVPQARLRRADLDQDSWEQIEMAAEELAACRIHACDRPGLTAAEISRYCLDLAAKKQTPDLVVIDYLQLMQGDEKASKSENRNQELGKISMRLKSLARQLNAPVVALSQLSRGVEARSNKRPMLSDLRDSGSIEQDADVVAMVYRDEYYEPDSCQKGVTELIVAKHRHGPTGTVKLLFDAQRGQFLPMGRY